MNILELLKQPIFSLPKNYDGNLPDFLENCYSDFLANIDKLDEGSIVEKIKANREKMSVLCNLLVQSQRSYYSGLPAKAYADFEGAMKYLEDFLFPKKRGYVVGPPNTYYRARNGANVQFTKNDMFHIPFDKREYCEYTAIQYSRDSVFIPFKLRLRVLERIRLRH